MPRAGNLSAIFGRVPEEERHANALLRIREKRWAVYVTKAAVRFESWWKSCVIPTATPMSQGDILGTVDPVTQDSVLLAFNEDNLPPLGE